MHFVRGGGSEDPQYVKKMFSLLILAQLVTLCCDVILLALMYKDMVLAKLIMKTSSYAIKSEVEFKDVSSCILSLLLRRMGLAKIPRQPATTLSKFILYKT
jgi:hypothetical protein